MSAICGIYCRNGHNVNSKDIKEMNDLLSHRGHDGSSILCGDQIAFGHQMLWTTKESMNEILPYKDISTGLMINADVRLDNREYLAKKLNIENDDFNSDSYFILKSYEKWGEKCPQYLIGDFSFSIWDENNLTLFCARDHIGVKPFYYFVSEELFAFASEIKALLNIEGIPLKLNENMIALFLLIKNDNQLTFFEGINSFPPSHSITINKDTIKLKKYWSLDKISVTKLDSEEEYANKFQEIFREAVKCRLRSAYPIGFQLSGGLDSSSVVCMAQKIMNENKFFDEIKSYSFVFDNMSCDERYFINKVIETAGITPDFFHAEKLSPLKNIGNILSSLDQPVLTPNIALLWGYYKNIADNDVRVILGGEGGDQVISHGDYYFRDLAIDFKLKTLFYELKCYSKHQNLNFFKLFLNKIIFTLIPEFFKSPFIFLYNKSIKSYYNKEFIKEINLNNLLNESRSKIQNLSAKKDHYNTITQETLAPVELIDNIASNFSIEPRHPFLDKRLIEFCYSIPDEMKFKFGWSRYILRIGLNGVIPVEIQWRKDKANLDPFYENNLLFEKKLLNKILSYDKMKDYLNFEKINEEYKKYEDGKTDSDSIYWIWRAVILTLWLNITEKIDK